MADTNAYLQTFAGGEFGAAMSSRVAIDSYQAACEIAENWFSKAQGPMDRRPSLEYVDNLGDDDDHPDAVLKVFEFDVDQNYVLVLRDGYMQFFLNDGPLLVDTPTATIPNGTFNNFSSWTDNSTSGATASAADNVLTFNSNGAGVPIARTTFTVNEANIGHRLEFYVGQGPISVRVGTSAGSDNLMVHTELRRGFHKLEFIPTTTGTHHLQFYDPIPNSYDYIDDVRIDTASRFELLTPWTGDDLRGVFTAQDGDRLYMMHRDYPPKVLERRGHRSWSLIDFEPDDGPFDAPVEGLTMQSNGFSGVVIVTASGNYFEPGDVRRLLRLTHSGQYARKVGNHDGIFSEAIKVSGIGADRVFRVTVSGTFTGTVSLERSVGNENSFSKVLGYSAAVNHLYNDSYPASDVAVSGAAVNDELYTASQSGGSKGRMDNQTVFYRLAILPNEWTSGTATLELNVNSGSQTGIARLVTYISPTQMYAVINADSPFARTGKTDVWEIGAWTAEKEYPNVCAFAHGRLWAFRRRQIWSSVSDDYFSFQDGTDADLSIQLTLRSKSAEGVRWARELDFLCIGTRNEEYVIRSTSAAEPVGPTTAEPTLQGEEGGALIAASVGGDSIIYVHRNQTRVIQFAHNPRALSEDSFVSVDLTRLNPETCEDGIINVTVQQEPDRRIFAVLRNGVVKPALFRREEEVVAWSTMTTQGLFIDSAVVREADSDAVYFITRRQIAGVWTLMLERLRSEVILNDEDLVHLDCMLETPIDRLDAAITPSSIELGAVTIDADEDVFVIGDEDRILWVNGGRIRIDTYVSPKQVTGTVVYPLLGKQNVLTGVYEPALVPPGRWGIATPTSVVSGLEHLEGMTVEIWADMAYMGSQVVDGGQVTLSTPCSRIFVGLGFQSLWKSLKLAYGAVKGTAVNQPKRVVHMGVVFDRTSDTLLFGDTPGKLKRLMTQTQAALLGGRPRYFTGEVHESFSGTHDIDTRIIIASSNPGPATIKALIPNIAVNER